MKHFRNVLQEWASDFWDISKIILAKMFVYSIKLMKRLFSLHMDFYHVDSKNKATSGVLSLISAIGVSLIIAVYVLSYFSLSDTLFGLWLLILTTIFVFTLWPIVYIVFNRFFSLFDNTLLKQVLTEYAINGLRLIYRLVCWIDDSFSLFNYLITNKFGDVEEFANRADRKKKLDKDPDISRLTDDHDDIDFPSVEELIGKSKKCN